ncbi:MAG: hypothetical protein V4719_00910 [Planctomycetota bacterium]
MSETLIPPGDAVIQPRIALEAMLVGAGFDNVTVRVARHGEMRWHATAGEHNGIVIRGYGSPQNCVRYGMVLTKGQVRQWNVAPRGIKQARADRPKIPHPVVNGQLLILRLRDCLSELVTNGIVGPRDEEAIKKRLERRREWYL